MSPNLETLDITLLRNNKNEFIIRCQRIISIVVRQYIAKGMFAETEYRDIKQSVTLELIKRLPLIERNYNGEALMVTYVNVVIDNICLRIHETEGSMIKLKPMNEEWNLTQENIDNSVLSNEHVAKDLLIANELERFTLALNFFFVRRYKIVVFLKTYFSIPITSEELRGCFPNISTDDLEPLVYVFDKQLQSTIEFANIGFLTALMQKYEQTAVSEESVRRLTLRYIEKLIRLMNGDPPIRAHTKDSIKFLLEHYSELHSDSD